MTPKAQTSTDTIRKQVMLRAPRARVWQALTNAQEFGRWFGVETTDTFAPGARVRGRITHKGYDHLTWDVTIDRMEPERLFSFRWHPNAIDVNKDYSSEPTTLVVFELEEVAGGTMVTVVESGFDKIPLDRRAEAYRGNDEGWGMQMDFIKQYVEQTA